MTAPIASIASATENLLAQMRHTARAAGFDDIFGRLAEASHSANLHPASQAATTHAPTSGFADVLKEALDKVAAMQNSASAKAQAFTLGEPDVSLNDVMIDTQKASLALQATVQVRNRLVAAYQEIANMAV